MRKKIGVLGVSVVLMVSIYISIVGARSEMGIKKENAMQLEWEKTYGGKGNDYFYSVKQANNGYILAGYTYSNIKKNDGWLLKTDWNGTIIWERKYGGYTTNDGGYIAAGKKFHIHMILLWDGF